MTASADGQSSAAEAQEAFVGLLTTPLASARVNAVLYSAVQRHRAQLAGWAGRLGYRLVISGSVARLHRDPAGPQRTAAPPPWDPPPRRVLVLTALLAAACEGTDLTTTVQILSDEIRALSASPGARITPYNPDRRTERQAFVRALDQLTTLGILLRRTSDEALLRQWEEDGSGVGAGFEVDRDALLQFTDPGTVALAYHPEAGQEAGNDDSGPPEASAGNRTAARITTRSQRMLRTLVEDTALLYADLHPLDAEYARGQRAWLADRAQEMTGGTVEMRDEGMLLRLPADRPASAAATAQFPAATAPSWFALKMLDAAMAMRKPAADGQIALADSQVSAVAAQVYRDNEGALTIALRESPARMRSVVEAVLTGCGLIRVSRGDWTILPVAGRYRDSKALWEPTLEDLGSTGDLGNPEEMAEP